LLISRKGGGGAKNYIIAKMIFSSSLFLFPVRIKDLQEGFLFILLVIERCIVEDSFSEVVCFYSFCLK
jgi:hypothetical protein